MQQKSAPHWRTFETELIQLSKVFVLHILDNNFKRSSSVSLITLVKRLPRASDDDQHGKKSSDQLIYKKDSSA